MIPETGTSVNDFLMRPFIPLMDDISPSAIQLITSLGTEFLDDVDVYAFLLYPDTASDWQPVWITSAGREEVSGILADYQRNFEQNRYVFKGFTIEKMFIADRTLYTFSTDEWTAISESSIALEEMIRASDDPANRLDLAGYDSSAEWIMNLGAAGTFVRQNALINLYPSLDDLFHGAGILPLRMEGDMEGGNWNMDGSVNIEAESSDFLKIFTTEPASFHLDRYIPVNASSFFLYRADVQTPEPFSDTLMVVSETDQFLLENEAFTERVRGQLLPETAFVTFTRSGPSSESEYLYLKSIRDSSAVIALLDQLYEEDLVEKDAVTYSFNSLIAAKLFGSQLFSAPGFYLTVYQEAIALAPRKGLAESIGGDTARRRVVYYNDGYRNIRASHPANLTTFLYADAEAFEHYLQPWLHPQNYTHPLLNPFEQIVLTTSYDPPAGKLNVSLRNITGNRTEQPYTEQWLFSLAETELTGFPVTGDLTGTGSNEVVFATDNGRVYVLAADGTSIFQVTTGEDTPVGSPVLYDWYGNNSLVIMQAAGNKIYAWNTNGDPLPSFPVIMNELITTPLLVEDLTSNGMGEMIFATADRQLHVLNNQGRPLRGWPQSTNTPIQDRPVIGSVNNVRSVIAFAENTLHSWAVNGILNPGYPKFLPVQMSGSPAIAGNHIIGSGMDGKLYAVGSTPLFLESLSTIVSRDPLILESVPVANTSLLSAPRFQSDLQLRGTEGLTRGDVIALQTSSGSIFLHHRDGTPLSVHAMGQPGSAAFSPLITDLNGDGRSDLVALADFGRLYAWDLLSGERLSDLPTAGMNYPYIGDFLNNGKTEIIAQTRDGLVCWTINFSRREASE